MAQHAARQANYKRTGRTSQPAHRGHRGLEPARIANFNINDHFQHPYRTSGDRKLVREQRLRGEHRWMHQGVWAG